MVQKYWSKNHNKIDYTQKDQSIIKEFKGTHPKVMKEWLPKTSGLFQGDQDYILTRKEKKHRIMIKLENFFNIDLSKKHYKMIP